MCYLPQNAPNYVWGPSYARTCWELTACPQTHSCRIKGKGRGGKGWVMSGGRGGERGKIGEKFHPHCEILRTLINGSKPVLTLHKAQHL